MSETSPEELLALSMRYMEGLGPSNIDLDRSAIDCASAAADAGYQPAVDFILATLIPYLVKKYLAIYRSPSSAVAPAVKLMRLYLLEQIDTVTFKVSLREEHGLTHDIANELTTFSFLLRGKTWVERMKQQSQ